MGTLAAELRRIREAGEERRPPELTAIMKRATEDLQASGITGGIPQVGDAAPLFARPDLDGATVRLSAMVRKGPVVVSFFRGRW